MVCPQPTPPLSLRLEREGAELDPPIVPCIALWGTSYYIERQERERGEERERGRSEREGKRGREEGVREGERKE